MNSQTYGTLRKKRRKTHLCKTCGKTEIKRMNRPTGIIRTLPSLYNDGKNQGYRRYVRSIRELEQGRIEAIYIAMAQMPKIEVLHVYLLIEGKIRVRMNLAGYEPGDAAICWDSTIRQPKHWAVCSGLVSKPPEKIYRKGFQGFRYTEDLW